jgi:hypothetical protein
VACIALALDVGRDAGILGASEANDTHWIISLMIIFLSPQRDIIADQKQER